MQPIKTYCKISIVSPELIFVQKAFLVGLFVGELIFRGVITGENVNSLKQLTLAVHGLIYRGMLIIGRIFASEIWGGGFGRWGGGWLIIRILQYFTQYFSVPNSCLSYKRRWKNSKEFL